MKLIIKLIMIYYIDYETEIGKKYPRLYEIHLNYKVELLVDTVNANAKR
jgi:hypothetical protein